MPGDELRPLAGRPTTGKDDKGAQDGLKAAQEAAAWRLISNGGNLIVDRLRPGTAAPAPGISVGRPRPQTAPPRILLYNLVPESEPSALQSIPKYAPSNRNSSIDPIKMGVDAAIYPKLGEAALQEKCIIFIRKTSAGSVGPFSSRSAVGKKLVTKGKSSLSYFTSGTIPFFASLSKKIGDWAYEQNTLVEVTKEDKKKTKGAGETEIKKYAYIPKLIAINDSLIAKVGDQYPEGVKEISNDQNGLLVEVNDRFGEDKSIKSVYYLKKINFEKETESNAVLKCNDYAVAEPAFLRKLKEDKAKDNAVRLEGFQVFIKKESIYAEAVFKTIKELWAYEIATTNIKGESKTPNDTLNSEKTRLNLNFEAGDKQKPKVKGEKIDGEQDLWDYFWSNYKKFQPGSYLTDGQNPLELLAKEVKIGNDVFYPVNVLSIFTRGTIREKEKSKQTPQDLKNKKYYEVVADYDVFMIAPSVELLMDQMSYNTGDFIKGRVTNELLKNAYSKNLKSEQLRKVPITIKDIENGGSDKSILRSTSTLDQEKLKGIQAAKLTMIENSDFTYFEKYSNDDFLTAYKKRFIPQADAGGPKHGVTSEYEKIEVRRSINVNMGISSVQHGTEIANVFHISDIEEPVMMFTPGVKNVESDLFFLDLKTLFMLFDSLLGERTIKNHKPGKYSKRQQEDRVVETWDPDYEVDITFPSDNIIARDYALLFNLNWGTDYYFKLTLPKKRVEEEEEEKKKKNEQYNCFQKEKEYFDTIIGELENIAFPIKDKTKFHEVFSPESYTTAPPPIKTFMLFLYQNYKLYEISDHFSNTDFKRKFISKLLFWGYYYAAIFEQCAVFAPKVGINPKNTEEAKAKEAEGKIKDVQTNYKAALLVIKILAEKLVEGFRHEEEKEEEKLTELKAKVDSPSSSSLSTGLPPVKKTRNQELIEYTQKVGREELLKKDPNIHKHKIAALTALNSELNRLIDVELPYNPTNNG